MNKTVLTVFSAVCALAMVSCDTPKDNRPSAKASVDYVQPGTRSTYNVSDLAGDEHPVQGTVHEEVMPNHDMGTNTIQPGDTVTEEKTNTKAGAIKR